MGKKLDMGKSCMRFRALDRIGPPELTARAAGVTSDHGTATTYHGGDNRKASKRRFGVLLRARTGGRSECHTPPSYLGAVHALAVEAATIGAWAAVATVVIYIILAIYAGVQVNEARKLREEQTRPFVVAEFVPDFLIAFRIKNIGATLAKDVTIEWDTWPVVTMDDPTWKSKDSTSLFGKGIPSLGPGQDISTTFDHFPNRVEKKLPMQYRVTVRYSSFDGRRPYSELFILDLDLYANLRNVRKRTTHDLVEEVKRIRRLMDKWTDTGSRGLIVGAYDRERHQAREVRPLRISRARHTYRKGGVRSAGRYILGQIKDKFGLHEFGN